MFIPSTKYAEVRYNSLTISLLSDVGPTDEAMSAGHFSAFITPVLKNPSLDATNIQSYRPVTINILAILDW